MSDDHLARIRKCLALAQSDNPHEAAVALRQAQHLMVKFGLDERSVAFSTFAECLVLRKQKRYPRWHSNFIHIIQDVFGVTCVLGAQGLKFIGTKARAEIAAYTYTVVLRAISTARKRYIAENLSTLSRGQKVAAADLYCEGFVYAIHKEVQALVLDEAEIALRDAYMDTHYSHLTEAKLVRDKPVELTEGNVAVLIDGLMDGQGVSLHRPVDGAMQPRLSHARDADL